MNLSLIQQDSSFVVEHPLPGRKHLAKRTLDSKTGGDCVDRDRDPVGKWSQKRLYSWAKGAANWASGTFSSSSYI